MSSFPQIVRCSERQNRRSPAVCIECGDYAFSASGMQTYRLLCAGCVLKKDHASQVRVAELLRSLRCGTGDDSRGRCGA